jgi:hypothetical protein
MLTSRINTPAFHPDAVLHGREAERRPLNRVVKADSGRRVERRSLFAGSPFARYDVAATVPPLR